MYATELVYLRMKPSSLRHKTQIIPQLTHPSVQISGTRIPLKLTSHLSILTCIYFLKFWNIAQTYRQRFAKQLKGIISTLTHRAPRHEFCKPESLSGDEIASKGPLCIVSGLVYKGPPECRIWIVLFCPATSSLPSRKGRTQCNAFDKLAGSFPPNLERRI